MALLGTKTWSNWAKNQTCHPTRIERPLREAGLQRIVRKALRQGRRIRPVGPGHSFTALACTDDVLVSLERMNLIRTVDANLVTVQAGVELAELNRRLDALGLAMTNLGDIAYQSLAGATATGTHGTGIGFTGLAGQIRSMRIVTATGDIVACSPTQNAELFHCARVGLGAFGIVSEMTIEVEPSFNLHAVEGPRPISDVLADWDRDVADNDHYEFFWIPGSDRAMTKRNRRTQEPIQPMGRFEYLRDKVVAENLAFGAMTKLAARRPSSIPRLRKMLLGAVGSAEYTDASYKVFASPRWVRFVEMEYSVAMTDVPEILQRIEGAVADAGLELLFPVEVRTAAADDIPLSTAYGRASGYIAVHRAAGIEYRPYFELVEAIMDEFDGRPHWGKMHFQTASTLAPRYPEWDRFQAVRAELDPAGLFSNPHLDRVLG